MQTVEDKMSTTEVYTIPSAQNVDGLNLSTEKYPYVFKHRIDDVRLEREDNVLLSTYPRTGTTWMAQVLSLLIAGEDKYEESKKIRLDERVRYMEITYVGEEKAQIETLHDVPVPRAVKTHLPYRFIRKWIDEDNLKTIITTRNPKDTLVSIFHFYQNMEGYEFSGDWNDFFEHIKAGKQIYGDQADWLKDWSDNKHRAALLTVRFEDMKRDIKTQVKRIAAFLDLPVTARFLEKLANDAHVTSMRSDAAVASQRNAKPNSKFIRRGQTGDWRQYFTVEQNEWFDNKYKKVYEELDIDIHYD